MGDLADIAVREGLGTDNVILDVVGPGKYTYKEFVRTIGRIIGKNKIIIPMPRSIVYLTGLLAGLIHGDTVITKEELKGLMANTLAVESEPIGTTRFSEWAKANASTLGRNYTSELERRKDRKSGYRSN
jgi:NADH dehydrogenase